MYDSNEHTFAEAIQVLKAAAGHSEESAAMLAQTIDREGSAVVFRGTRRQSHLASSSLTAAGLRWETYSDDDVSAGGAQREDGGAPLLLRFDEVTTAGLGVADVGGKGLRLAELSAAARPGSQWAVPPGVCVTTAAYRAVAADPLDSPLPAGLWAGLTTFLASEPPHASYAVRSSSNFEDTDAGSFAGQYATVLNVRKDVGALESAIRQCWASQTGEAAAAYLANQLGSDGAGAEMGVVVQRMLAPSCSGVCFTGLPCSTCARTCFAPAGR
jgi:hypothetical protein